MMDRKDPIEALKGYYGEIDEVDAPAGLGCRQPQAANSRLRTELLKAATACAAGVIVACLLAAPGTPAPLATPATTASGMSIRAQMARSGMDPDDFVGGYERRSEGEGGRRWGV